MTEKERLKRLDGLDKEMREFRLWRVKREQERGLLKRVRVALGLTADEVARRREVDPSLVYYTELRERRGGVTIAAMDKMARAMGCEFVYGIVPAGGKTLKRLADELMWMGALGTPPMTAREWRQLVKRAGQRGSAVG